MNMIKRKPATAKTRKKSREELNAEGRERKRQKKHRGNPAGNRQQEAENKQQAKNTAPKDPRIGSKKPIPLIVGDAPKVAKKKPAPAKVEPVRLTPEQELDLLENDARLDELLSRLENGEKLNAEEQAYTEKTLDRIDELMVELGIEFEDDDDEEKTEDIMQLLKGK
ncbi:MULTISPECIES: Der GTPase-activating protein YihI [Proteus]|jgi:ribosome assembly protein YihI (activator of Der GTPase)|uniref:Der GTPase-activating protein YihI n=1 Tax=Proteus TaxID=583 RepID=UPI000504BB99|nr:MULTISPECIES: Der GTPase-activating protein YihI [Proteus]NBN61840.1 Der GTPase-activating protein YihI [Proteus sp. G2639]RNT30342.1 Der GTPase-activating protein YihI [Proteus mirabilis]AYY82319.1 Der GTPase-activating protein YihI [Proteus vulgaris]KGA57938.1 der GTPase activator family protein [Proteus vulgaris]MBG5970082.1 Der GTPase-activating protein YihI [Proteus vulgaris]